MHETLNKMASSNSTGSHDCLIEKTGAYRIILMFFMLPLHIILIKIIAKDFQFSLPRHSILFSLSLADATLVCGLCLSGLVDTVTTLKVHSTGCVIYRAVSIFIDSLTTVVCSLSITALSVERYIACIHSFYLHDIFTESRLRYGSILGWITGLLLGIIATITCRYDDIMLVPNPSPFHYILVVFVIPSSTVMFIIQVRLYLFSREKINQVIPAGAFGVELELAHYRKKQFKVAFMAGIVALAFYVCVIPLTVVLLYELLSGRYISSPTRPICIALSFWNSFADPLIYGFGMADTRKMILRDLKRMKQYPYNILPENGCLYAN